MIEYLTKDNITFALALLGSFGTAISFIASCYKNRINFDISPVEFKVGENGIVCYLMLVNNSHTQLTLTDISININGIYYPAIKIPEIVRNSVRRSGDEITSVHTDYSIAFPIVLSGQYATSGYFYFPLPKGTALPTPNTFSLKVCTSRGKVVEKILELDALQ